MTLKELAVGALAKLELGMCAGSGARDEWGDRVDARSIYACRWCSLGAINAVAGDDDYELADELIRLLLDSIGQETSPQRLVAWHDSLYAVDPTLVLTEWRRLVRWLK